MRTDSLTISSPLTALRGVGPKRAVAFAEAGYERLGELLFHLPARYEDRRRLEQIERLHEEDEVTLRGRLSAVRKVRVRRRNLSLVRARLADGTGELPVLWFNQPYLADKLEPETDYLLHGRIRRKDGSLELVNPSCERADHASHAGRIVPIYPSLAGWGPMSLRRLFDQLLQAISPAQAFPETVPEELLARYGLPPLGAALEAVHRPDGSVPVEMLNEKRSPAHQRLIYGEFLNLQLELGLLRRHEIRREKRHRYRIDDEVREVARRILPFRLTEAQRRVLKEIVDDLRGPFPMLRLLQGDVGSGKTIVAALAFVVALESGLQGAFMAPTELLAEQHFRGLERILGGRYRLTLLTGSAAERPARLEQLAAGEIQLAVGTHALIQEGVEFRRLGLAVVDEQHRFGVVQRRLLQEKGELPDMLVMTATPIPRSLALTAYGDLELSVLDELPPGRRPVATELAPVGERRRVYEGLRQAVREGARAYVVFPLIEESDKVDAASIEHLGEGVRRYLRGVSTAVLHGRLSAEERDRIMAEFASGRVQVLIATTVVEVGVDVPEATLMIIESAERFGLAQLHQLRGRVGRSERPSRCVAIHGRLSEAARRRLDVFASSTDGFRIAEADLEQRGPGELLGTRQAGLPAFRVANLVRDREWLQRARTDARELLTREGEPELEPLLERMRRRAASRYERFAGG